MVGGAGNPSTGTTQVNPFCRPNTTMPEKGMYISQKQVDAMSDVDIIHLIWEFFGISLDYDTDRVSIIKKLYQLSS